MALLIGGALGIAVTPANGASDHCASRDDVMRLLGEKYAETPVARGLSLDGRIIEVMTSKDGASWSIVVSTPDRTACIALAGDGWQGLAKPDARLVQAPQWSPLGLSTAGARLKLNRK